MTDFNINTTHFTFFKNYCKKKINSEQTAVGFIPFKFWKDICCDNGIIFSGLQNVNPQNLTKQKLNRDNLISYVNNSDYSFEEKLISIFAWGGMRKENTIVFFGHYIKYGGELEDILTDNKKSRQQKFEEISSLKLKNCKPAYFTKLMFFFSTNQEKPSYILDQWIAKSINLLLDKNLIKLDKQGYVKNNESSIYEYYCSFIEFLFIELKKEMDIKKTFKIEEFLFDVGGKENKKGEWRKYLDNKS
jgi:hypothetical protein